MAMTSSFIDKRRIVRGAKWDVSTVFGGRERFLAEDEFHEVALVARLCWLCNMLAPDLLESAGLVHRRTTHDLHSNGPTASGNVISSRPAFFHSNTPKRLTASERRRVMTVVL